MRAPVDMKRWSGTEHRALAGRTTTMVCPADAARTDEWNELHPWEISATTAAPCALFGSIEIAQAMVTNAAGFAISLAAGACAERRAGEVECARFLLCTAPCDDVNNELHLYCDADVARAYHPSDFAGPHSVRACVPLPASGSCELCAAPAEAEARLEAALAEYHEDWSCRADTRAHVGGCAHRDGDECCMELMVTRFCEEL